MIFCVKKWKILVVVDAKMPDDSAKDFWFCIQINEKDYQ